MVIDNICKPVNIGFVIKITLQNIFFLFELWFSFGFGLSFCDSLMVNLCAVWDFMQSSPANSLTKTVLPYYFPRNISIFLYFWWIYILLNLDLKDNVNWLFHHVVNTVSTYFNTFKKYRKHLIGLVQLILYFINVNKSWMTYIEYT